VPELPPGTVKDDQFFGKVETYRGQLAVRLPLRSPDAGAKVTVRAESQVAPTPGFAIHRRSSRSR
jgi:thiol:disulfide interchange protein DsbD